MLSALALLVVTSGVAVYASTVLLTAKEAESQSLRDAKANVASHALLVRTILQGTVDGLLPLSRASEIVGRVGGQEGELRSLLSASLSGSGIVSSLEVLDEKGVVVDEVPASTNRLGLDLSSMEAYIEAKRSASPVWTGVHARIEDGKRELLLFLPTPNRCLLAYLNFDSLAARIQEFSAVKSGAISVVDGGGAIIVDQQKSRVEDLKVDADFIAARLLAIQSPSLSYIHTVSGVRSQTFASKIPETGWFLLWTGRADWLTAAIGRSLAGSLLMAAIFWALAVALSIGAAQRLLSDVELTLDRSASLSDFESGGRSFDKLRFKETSAIVESMVAYIRLYQASDADNHRLKELNERLADALEELKRTRESAMEREKLAIIGDLSAGVAHEVNTPLGAILSSTSNAKVLLGGLSARFASLAGLDEGERRFLVSMPGRLPRGIPFLDSRQRRAAMARLAAALGGGARALEVAERLVDVGIVSLDEEELVTFRRLPQAVVDLGLDLAESLFLNRIVENSVEQISRIVNVLKTYSWNDSESLPLPCDLGSTISESLELIRHKLRRGVEVSFDQPESVQVLAKRDHLLQVWLNLLNNAGQAMGWKGHIGIEIKQEEGRVFVNIADSGPGVPAEIKDRLFKPFFTTKRRGEGTGLGLSMVQRIVRGYGGDVCYTPEPGKTVFSVSLMSLAATTQSANPSSSPKG